VAEIDSGALSEIRRTLNMAGTQASETELLDGLVSQTIDINGVVRRSLSLAGTGGQSWGLLENTHGGGSTTLSNTIDPFNPGDRHQAPFPPELNIQFEMWVLNVSMIMVSGTASNFTQGILGQLIAPSQTSWAREEDGTAPPVMGDVFLDPLARFDTITDTHGSGQSATAGLTEQGNVSVPVNKRIRRGTSLRWLTAATNAVSACVVINLGVFPVTTGQDAVT
jgi:hypothetical protein